MSGAKNGHGLARVTRTVLLFAAFLLFAALVWWVGPEIRIGESRPLDPPGWRLAVIAMVPALVLLPLLGGALAWGWRQLLPRSRPREPDPLRESCAQLLAWAARERLTHPNRQRGAIATWLAEQLSLRFAPDMLIVAEDEVAATLRRYWPLAIDAQADDNAAGDVFWSSGRCWLIASPEALSGWARALKHRRAPRAAVWLISESAWRGGASSPALAQMRILLSQWQQWTGRKLPLWVTRWTTVDAGTGIAWDARTKDLPHGFSVPVRRGTSGAAWQALIAEFRAILTASLLEPDLAPATALARLRVQQQCQADLESASIVFRQLGIGTTLFATAWLRGVFWMWEKGDAVVGLSGLVHVLLADDPAPRYRPRLALLRGLAVLALALGALLLINDIVVETPARHDRALTEWRSRRSEVRRAAYRAALPDSSTAITPALDTMTVVEDAQAQAEATIGTSLPPRASATLAKLEGQLWRQRLLPALLGWNRACVSQAAGPAVPSDLYRALATALSFRGEGVADGSDEALLRSRLAQCGASPEQSDAVLHQLARHRARDENERVAVLRDDIKAWRSALAGAAHYSLDERLWDGMREEMRPANAVDFTLSGALGPGAFWFGEAPAVSWFFTAEGLQSGFRASHRRYAAWIAEYRRVMTADGQPVDPVPSDADLAALDGALRARYVREASLAWETMFSAMHLVRSHDVGEAVDRAQTFASDASPFIQLLDVLEQQMPLPPRKVTSFWSRLAARIAGDWARVQYELGWRNSPRPAAVTTDPSYALAQRFAALRSYFPDDKGKAASRDRMIQTIQPIARYLGQQQAAAEFGGRPPAPASLKMLRVAAGRLPAPLRELMQDLAEDSGRELVHAQADTLAINMDAVPSYLSCLLDAPFPFGRHGSSELDWATFVQDFAPAGRIARILAENSSLIDTGATPWRPRLPPGSAGVQDMRARISWLQRATRIGQAWFPPEGGGLVLTMRAFHLDDDVLQARLTVDGQNWTYAHGPAAPVTIHWPGPTGSNVVEMELQRVDGQVVRRRYAGPWALLALIGDAERHAMRSPAAMLVGLGDAQGRWVISITSASAQNPLNPDLYRGLCPRRHASSEIDLFTPVGAPQMPLMQSPVVPPTEP